MILPMGAQQPTAYLVGAGACESLDFQPKPGDMVIAVDGGLDYLRQAHIEPDLALGDFDSLRGEKPDGQVLTYLPEKDESDMLLALRQAIRRNYKRVLMYGGLGGRLDHTLANIQTIAWASRCGVSACLVNGSQTILAVSDGELRLPKTDHGYLSVFCQGSVAEGVDLIGLKYTLDHAELRDDYPLGLSNEFIGEESIIRVRSGTLIVVIN